ncbi:MAG: tRNA uridine-5-carboxymethylaminomethyl(34) synthesis enzyme MnmG [Bacillota bacterium]
MSDVCHPAHCDVLVVGSGHAAVEAALAAARMGVSVVLLTLNPENIAGMPCNPAIGGPGKAQIVSEIDALGGEMALAADEATIEMRVLNSSKGPAVRSLRAQVDKKRYSLHMKRALESAGVRIYGGMATGLIVEEGWALGIHTSSGAQLRSRAVVLCTGVYLESRIIMGEVIRESGPLGESSAKGLSADLESHGLRLGRFKTGTSPRIARCSVRWDELKKEKGADEPLAFSFMSPKRIWRSDACYSTYTNEKTHEIIRANRDRAPLFDGTIEGVGPRYCPSIEDKVFRFPRRLRHQVFLEMESDSSEEVYLLGLSTSLPLEVQTQMVHSLPGLGAARITKPGYAIEYDYLLSGQLRPSLESIPVRGLYSAGQINGTSGYEEAAAQGLLAGANAAASVLGREPLVLGRGEAYIGVLIDDLVGTAIEEPYRMLTSRAEHRLLLRQSNADQRLTPIGRKAGLIPDARWAVFDDKMAALRRGREALSTGKRGAEALELLRKPESSIADFFEEIPSLRELPQDVLDELEVEAKYAGFIERQEREVRRLLRYREKRLPAGIDFGCIPGLSNEAREKLVRSSPATLGRALDAGVSPSDALILLAYLKEGKMRQDA